MSDNQFSLLKEKRFLPFFITQALGAFNDNVFKQAFVIMLSYHMFENLLLESQILVNLAAFLFILPFFLFSAIAGQFADKYEKSKMIRIVKLLETLIMLLACLGFYLNNAYLLLAVLFLMGFQSSVFGPLKYGYLPLHLQREELVGGNALVEGSTFLAILFGTIVAGILIDLQQHALIYLCITILSAAVLGFISSKKIPFTQAVDPELKINWNLIDETIKNIRFARNNKIIFLSILGISWFWFYGAIYLTNIPSYTKETLAGDKSVTTLILAFFCVGIGLGSVISEKLSAGRIEVGLVPIGAFGLSFFGYHLYLANTASELIPIHNYLEFLKQPGSFNVLFNVVMIGFSGGLYTVPLYAQIQNLADKKHISRLIAGLNIINALFMLVAAIFAIAILQKFTIPELFAIISVINFFVAVFIFTKAPEFIFRFITWCLINTIYRIHPKGLHNIPRHGPCVLVCNHVSYVDALIIGGYCKRNVRFVMYHKIFKAPLIGAVFKMARAIPIAPAHEDKKLMLKAFNEIAKKLKHGEIVCIFPEGKLTNNGEMNEFKAGIEKIIKQTPVPVVPLALKGLWGSWFSRYAGKAMKGWPRKFMAKIQLVAGEVIEPEKASAEYLYQQVKKLKDSV